MSKETDLQRLAKAHFEFARLLRRHMVSGSASKMSMYQLQSLMMIRENSGITMKELAEGLRVSSSTATALVARLHRDGYVRRAHDRLNRKLVRLSLTERGKTLIETEFRKKQEVFRSMFTLLPASDQRELARILQSLIHAYHHVHHS